MHEIRASFSKLKKKFKGSFGKGKPQPANAAGEGVGQTRQASSLPHPEPPVVVGGNGSREGGGVTDASLQQGQPGPVPTTGSNIDPGRPETNANGGQAGEPNTDTTAVPDPAQAVVPSNDGTGTSDVEEEGKSDWKSNAFATAKLLLRAVSSASDAFGPLKSVSGGLCFILDNCERTKANKQAIESLAPRIQELTKLLCEPVTEGDTNELGRRSRLERKLRDSQQVLSPLAEQGKVEGFFNNVENAGKLSDLVEDIRETIMEYQTSLQQDTYNKSCQLIEAADMALLDRMYHAPDAGYRCGDRQGCLRGTRQDVLSEIEHWLTDEQDHHIFWLNGLAGTGKSTIAQTFAETSFAGGKLGASFFCSRDFVDRSNLRMIFPTIAFQLAYQYSLFRKELLQILKAIPDVGRESLCSQLEKLIVGPLKASRIPTLIIIDALDECRDDQPASAILSVLSNYIDEIPNTKFFITGRPEPQIRSGFRLKPLRPITEVLRLHDVERSLVDGDIKLYFRTRLTEISKTRSDCDLADEWPSPSDVDILSTKASGLFIYASTAIKFIASKHHSPAERLALIISLPQSTIYEGKSGVDLLYTQVLDQAFHNVDLEEQELYSRFKTVLGAVVLVLNPLSVKALSDLLKVPNTSTTIRSLHSLLLVPDPEKKEEPVRVFHKSFPDFLIDPKRCKDKQFLIEPTVHHAEILLSCLRLMGERLKKNICNLNDYVLLSEVEDLSARQKDNIGEALQYASCFWTKHLLEIPGNGSCVEEVKKAIHEFFTTSLFYWIEVLVLTKNLGAGIYAMNDVERWCSSTGTLFKWTRDIHRFLLEHFETIHNSPSQIYYSALPFCPSSSIFQKHYSPELLGGVKVVKGLPAGWGACSRTVNFDSTPYALSCWGNTVAVGVFSGDIIILNAIVGSQEAVLSGHTGFVRSVAFSSDGSLLASGGDDKIVKLWDVQTGGDIWSFSGHKSPIRSVSISVDNTWIVSNSLDRAVYVWNIQTGESHCIVEPQTAGGASMSHMDPQSLISVCDKGWQWNFNNEQISPRYDGPHIAFSSDGAKFALWNKPTITVQDAKSKEVIAKVHVKDDADISDCCLSPDGRLIAAVVDGSAHVWDITSPDSSLIKLHIEHDDYILSLAFFSPSCLISAALDDSAKFWQIGTSPTDLVEANPHSVTLQAKDNVTITSDSDGIVKVWDILTGHCKESFKTPAVGDCKRDVQLINGQLISVHHNKTTIHAWDTKQEKFLWEKDVPGVTPQDLKISEDGSMIFCLDSSYLYAWSIQKGEAMGKVVVPYFDHPYSLSIDGSKVWVHYVNTAECTGWDFGAPGSPTSLSDTSPTRIHPNGVVLWDSVLSRVQDIATQRVIFQLATGFKKPADVQWNDQYLVACFKSGEVVVLDLSHVFSQ